MRVLYVTNSQRTGGWLAEAFAADSATDVRIKEVVGSAAGLAQLRDETYDVVLVAHDPNDLDALALIDGYRVGGADEPIVVLGLQSEQEMAALCYEVGADSYVCVNTSTTRNLIWVVARAVQRYQLVRENRRLNLAEQQRLQREHDEAERLLQQQRTLIGDMEAIRRRHHPSASSDRAVESPTAGRAKKEANSPLRKSIEVSANLPDELVNHYRELLRTYVIMGSGNLAPELCRLASMLASAGVTASQTMQLHVHVLEELIHGLGSRSTRHVMMRADLLVLEIMIHLAEGYRTRYRERVHPPVQKMLPGFDER
jgi:CheY-like chemotaxis protein